MRLIYVAATRARDHLVVSLYRNARGSKSAAARIEEFMQGADHLWQPFDPPAIAAPRAYVSAGEDGGPQRRHSRGAPSYGSSRGSELYAARGRPISAAATRLAQDAKEEQDVPDEPWRRGRAGTNIGRAVHAVLQVVDLRTGSDLDENVQAQAAAEGVPAQADAIARLVRRRVRQLHRAARAGFEALVAGDAGGRPRRRRHR